MLIALRDMSVGPHVIQEGDRLSADIRRLLPPGRIEALKAQRYVEEINDETAVARIVDELVSRVEKLEKRVDALPRPVGRPRKVEAN